MADPTRKQAHAPTVLAVSRYGTFWLLDARSGARRWQLMNGSHLATIDHGDRMIYVTYATSTKVRRDTRKPPLRSELPWHLDRPPEEVRQFRELLVTPAEVLALRAEDGSVAWRREGWVMKGGFSQSQPLPPLPGGHYLDGDLLLTDVTDYAEATLAISALEASTGAVRWHYTTSATPDMYSASAVSPLLGASAGRVYISVPGENRLDVLDTASGQLAWSSEHNRKSVDLYLSPGGLLLAEVDRGVAPGLVVRRTSDGRIAADLTMSPQVKFLGFSDTGIAYLAGGPEWHRWVEAIDTSTGEAMWHADRDGPLLSTHMDISIFAGNTFATPTSFYGAQLNSSTHLAEALAVSAQTGRQRWYWHSPSHLLGLLRLWGWRTPQVVAFALSQLRRNHSSRSSRRRQAHQSIGSRIRSLWETFRSEILQGQWLRPASLQSGVFSAAVYMGESAESDQIYVGTSMGLSVLRGSDHKLLWHQLLMMEITRIIPEPTQFPKRGEQPQQPDGTTSGDG